MRVSNFPDPTTRSLRIIGELTVMRAGFGETRGAMRISELMLSIPSFPQGDQTVLSTANASVLR